MPPRKPSIVVRSLPRSDGQLSVVEVSEKEAVLSNGEVVFLRYEKLRTLCEQLAQEQAVVWIRTWIGRDGEELIEVHRIGERSTPPMSVTTAKSEGAF